MLSKSWPIINGLFSRAHIEKCVTKGRNQNTSPPHAKRFRNYHIRQKSCHHSYIGIRDTVEEMGDEERPILPNLNCGFHQKVVKCKGFLDGAYAYQDRSTAQDQLSAPEERQSQLYEP